jgi:hypothetical protein
MSLRAQRGNLKDAKFAIASSSLLAMTYTTYVS